MSPPPLPVVPVPVPVPAPPTPPQPTSGLAVAGGVSGASVLIYIVDRLLANDGQVAATMLTKLSPLLGPVWASWPVVAAVLVIAWFAHRLWCTAQYARALESAAARASADALATSVGHVAEGLGALRGEVHSLRQDLRAHAESTDERFTTTDAALREFVRSELKPIGERVSTLERRRPPRAGPRPIQSAKKAEKI